MKHDVLDVIEYDLPCQMCENWDDRSEECKKYYGYTGHFKCNKRKADRGEKT